MAAQWQSDQSSCAGPSSVHLPRAVTCIASAQAMGKPSPAALCRPMGPFINSPAPWRSASPRGHSPGTHCCTCPAGKWMGGPHRVGLVVQQRGRSWAAGPAAQHAAAVCLRLAPRLDGMPGMPVMRQSCKQQQGAQVQREQTTTGRYLGDVTVPQQLHAKAVLVVPVEGTKICSVTICHQLRMHCWRSSQTGKCKQSSQPVYLPAHSAATQADRLAVSLAHLMVLSMSPTRYTACSMRRSSCFTQSAPAAAMAATLRSGCCREGGQRVNMRRRC